MDMFFRSLADAHGSRAVCVVLSGTGPNGSSGLKRIKEYGGLVVVQDPETAKYGDMPRNSIATGLVDLVLPIAEMPGRIREFHEQMRADGRSAELVAVAPTDGSRCDARDADAAAHPHRPRLLELQAGHGAAAGGTPHPPAAPARSPVLRPVPA